MRHDDLFERLSQDDGGAQDECDRRNAEVADWLRGRHCSDVQESEGILTSPHGLAGAEHIAAEQYALTHDCWIKQPLLLGRIGPNGDENECFVSEDGTTIYKVNMLTHTGGSILKAFDKVSIHNLLFPETRYSFVGFTNMGFARSAFPIFKQVFVKDACRATDEDIAAHMTALGFLPDNDCGKPAAWRADKFLIWDLLPKNVLKDRAGNIYVVYAEIGWLEL